MHNQNANKPKQPFCPSCAQPMRLSRITSRFDGLTDLYTFECRACGIAHIEAASIPATQAPLAY
jgi:ribosomal protein L37AE/L43A